MGTIINFTSALPLADIEESVRDLVPAVASRLLRTQKQNDLSGLIEFSDTLTALEQTDVVAAINSATVPIRYETIAKFKTGTTSTNTPITTAALQLPENCQVKIFAIVMARQGANQKQFELKVAATRGTGNASLIGTVVNQSWGSPTWAATLVASGQGVAVQVTGANGVTITWAGKISYEAAVL